MNHSRSILNHGIISSKLLLVFLFFAILLQYATAQTPPPPPDDPFASIGPGFNPSMAIIMVVLISAFFFMGFFSVYIRQCADRRFGRSYQPSLALAGAPRRSRGVARGLDASVIASFPTFLYSAVKGLRIGKDSLECAVCLNEFEDDETLRLIPKCSHVFHPDCIDAWLESHTTCPVCRANLVPKPGEVLSCAAVQVFEPDTNPVQPEPPRPDADEVSICVAVAAAADNNDHQHRDVVQSPDLNLINTSERANQNRPPRSRSTGWRFSGLFPRSRSTGNSLVQLGENCDRFTLRLPEEVRSQLMNSTLNRSKSCMAFPRARSLRRGYRSRSVGNWRGRNYFYYERFDQDGRSDQLGFTLTPPFISKTGSVRSPKVVGDEEVVATPSRSLFRSIKSSFDRLSHGGDNNAGEQSSDRLRSDSQV